MNRRIGMPGNTFEGPKCIDEPNKPLQIRLENNTLGLGETYSCGVLLTNPFFTVDPEENLFGFQIKDASGQTVDANMEVMGPTLNQFPVLVKKFLWSPVDKDVSSNVKFSLKVEADLAVRAK